MRAGAIDELLSPPLPAPPTHSTCGAPWRAHTGTGKRWRQAQEGGGGWLTGESGGGWLTGESIPRKEPTKVPHCMHKARRACALLHAQGTPCMCLIACTRHAVHVPRCMHKARRASASSAHLSRPVREDRHSWFVRAVAWPLRFTSRYCRVDTSCHSLSGHRSSVWGWGSVAVTTSCARSVP